MTRQRIAASLAAVVGAAAIPFGGAAWLSRGPSHYTGLDAMRARIHNVDASLRYLGVTLNQPEATADPPIAQNQAETTAARDRAGPSVDGSVRGSALVRFTWKQTASETADSEATYTCLCWLVDVGAGTSPSKGPAPAPGTSFNMVAINALTGNVFWEADAS